jgi:antibiotic biosynthesis monooxygenase (ABM) superfamily enzyme
MSRPVPHQSSQRPEESSVTAPTQRPVAGPPNKHELAIMIWVAVFPTLTALNLVFGPWLSQLHPVVRTFALATVAVPVVIYGLMPRLHALRARILVRRAA